MKIYTEEHLDKKYKTSFTTSEKIYINTNPVLRDKYDLTSIYAEDARKERECKIDKSKLTDNIMRDVNNTFLTGTMRKSNLAEVATDVIASIADTTLGNVLDAVDEQDRCLKGTQKKKEIKKITKVEDCNIDKKELALKAAKNLNKGMLYGMAVNATTGGAATPAIVGGTALSTAYDIKDALDKKQECKIKNGFIDEPEKKNQIFKEELVKKVAVSEKKNQIFKEEIKKKDKVKSTTVHEDAELLLKKSQEKKVVTPKVVTPKVVTPKVVTPKVVAPPVIAPRVFAPRPSINHQFNMARHNAPRFIAKPNNAPRFIAKPSGGSTGYRPPSSFSFGAFNRNFRF